MALNDNKKEGNSICWVEKAIKLMIKAMATITNSHICTTLNVCPSFENESINDPRPYMSAKPRKIRSSRGITPIPFVGSRERMIIKEEITKAERDRIDENIRRGEA